MEKYNGWTNYATWRVSLEYFDGLDYGELWDDWSKTDLYVRAERLKEMLTEYIYESCNEDLLLGWLLTFIEDVNFMEIAKNTTE